MFYDYPVNVNTSKGKKIIYYKHMSNVGPARRQVADLYYLVINYYLQLEHHIVKAQKMKCKTQRKIEISQTLETGF